MVRKSISVAMAVYNGEKYLKDQLDSILPQLYKHDELVISIDLSTDRSREIIESYNNPKIKILDGPGKGVISNFENAIMHTKNELIFLCDQDDVWREDKLDNVSAVFDFEDVNVVVHDAKIVDSNLNVIEDSFFKFRNSKSGIINNIIHNSYIGCCMAFKRELKEYVLPFPKNIPMHDQYIGLVGEIRGKNKFLNQNLLLYRRHDENASSINHSSIMQMIVWRIQIILALFKSKGEVK